MSGRPAGALRLLVATALLTALAATGGAGFSVTPAGVRAGQVAPGQVATTTTVPAGSSASTTSSTQQPASTTTAPRLPATTAPPTVARPSAGDDDQTDGAPEDDSAPAVVPQDVVTVPPADPLAAPDPMAPLLREIATVSLDQASKGLRQAEVAQGDAANAVGQLTYAIATLESHLSRLESDKAEAVARVQRTRLALRRRAVAGYMGSSAAPLNGVLESTDFNDLSRRLSLLQSVFAADRARIAAYDAAREEVGRELERVIVELDGKRSAHFVASAALAGADSAMLAKQIQLTAVKAGNTVVGGGFVFPVAMPRSFGNSFGAPRMLGTEHAHFHEGTDIFAPAGTALRAVERGVLIKVGSDLLGGTKLWLVGASGTRYYYAHLSGFAEGVTEGKTVAAGDVVGFVGSTGNATGGAAHLHFEVHPGGGAAVNPYPLLKIVDEGERRVAAMLPPTTTTSTTR